MWCWTLHLFHLASFCFTLLQAARQRWRNNSLCSTFCLSACLLLFSTSFQTQHHCSLGWPVHWPARRSTTVIVRRNAPGSLIKSLGVFFNCTRSIASKEGAQFLHPGPTSNKQLVSPLVVITCHHLKDHCLIRIRRRYAIIHTILHWHQHPKSKISTRTQIWELLSQPKGLCQQCSKTTTSIEIGYIYVYWEHTALLTLYTVLPRPKGS